MARSIQDVLSGASGGGQFPPPGGGGGGGGGGGNDPGLVPPPPEDPPWDPYDIPLDSVIGGATMTGGSISPTNTLSVNIGDVGGTMTGGSQSGITGRDAITQPGGNGMDLFSNKNFLILGIGALFVILVLNKKRR